MKKFKSFFRNIDLRKFLGTIVGGIFFLCCVAYFTYAYYEWKSDETSISLTIHESDVKCTMGPNVNVSNIGPVLKISDGVKYSFAIENSFTEDMAVSVILDITSISDSLLNETFKWAIVQENESNFDYNNPIIEGSFKNFREGSNLVTTALQVPSQQTVNYEFIVYIDGNFKNDISMMQNSMEASLTLGNCGTDYIRYDELTQFAFYSADDNSLTFTYDYPVAVGDTYLGKTVTNLYTGYDTTKYNLDSAVPWYSDGNYDDIVSVTFLETTSPISTAFWFYGFKNAKNIELEKLDTSKVTTMRYMFFNCKSLTILKINNLYTGNVTDMIYMFRNCENLESLDLSTWNTSNVISMGYLFADCSRLVNLNISRFDTSNVKSMSSMFENCKNLGSLDLSTWNTSNVISMDSMFANCIKLEKLDLSNWDTSNITRFREYISKKSMFEGCSGLIYLDVSNFDVSNVKDFSNLFRDCNNLRYLDLSGWNMNTATNIASMFLGCSNLTQVDLSNWDTSNVTSMGWMFLGCSNLTQIDLSSFDTSNVTTMNGMFLECSSLTNLDLSNFDTSNVESFGVEASWQWGGMFNGCKNLTNLNLEGWNTSSAIYMGQMFYNCKSLTSLDLSSFDTSNVKYMCQMFIGCTSLTNLNLDGWNTSSLIDVSKMFSNCFNVITSITIMNPNITYYDSFTQYILVGNSASITLYYVGDDPSTTDINESTYEIVETIRKSGQKIINGGCKGDYCTVDETVTPADDII